MTPTTERAATRRPSSLSAGSTELITWIDHLLVTESLAVPIPTFGRWTDQPLETGKRVDMHLLREEDGFVLDVDAYVRFVRERGSRVAVVCQPDDPDGGYVHRERIVRMLDQLSDLDLVVVDESFLDFVDAEPECSVAAEGAIRHDVIVLTSLGKDVGLHGVRFGYMVANPGLRDHLVTEHGVHVRGCGNELGMTSQFVRLVVRPADDVAHLVAGLHAYAATVAPRG